MKKITLNIFGMTCSACSNGLEKYLNKQNGIQSANVNLIMSNATIVYDESIVTRDDLDRFVKEAGFKSEGIFKFNSEEKVSKKEKYRLIFLSLISVVEIYVAMAHMINLPEFYLFSHHHNLINNVVLQFILTTIVLICGFHIIKNGIKNLIHKTPNMDTLVTMSVLSSYIYSIVKLWNFYKNGISVDEIYFETTTMVIFFIEIGKYIESKNINKTKEALKKLVTITPQNAVIIKDGDEKEVTIDEINKDDIVICRPGQKIAVDGEIIEGTTHIDESFITGESTPVKKEKNMKVIAGSINYEGSIRYKAEKIGKESTISEIVKMCVEATNTKAPISKLVDKISSIFVPLIILIAIIKSLVWWFI